MRYTLMTAAVAAATVLGASAVSAQDHSGKHHSGNQHSGKPFHVTLDGESEVPGPGDPDGSGTATIRINPGQQQLCYTMKVSDIQPASAAHIHEAPVGEAGPVVVDLQFTGTMGRKCVHVDRSLALEIIRNPEDYYVNVHNTEFPLGAVRGQLGM